MSAFNAGGHADTRLILLSDWLDEHTGGQTFDLAPASADASFRRYFRVRLKLGTRIVMDAPPERESLAAYIDIAGRLRSIGVAAPQILAADSRHGFLLMSDLGDQTYLDALRAGADPDVLYGDALHALVAMQSRLPFADLPPCDGTLLVNEMQLFRDWLLGEHLGLRLTGSDASAWQDCVDYLAAAALEQPRVFVHRDYHSRNLMVGPPGAPGVLDFQDAVAGPITYDLVSLLKDCYVAWPDEQVREWLNLYFDLALQTPLGERFASESKKYWRRCFDEMGVQRHLKASGIFARLNHRDGKPHYLADVPRTLAHITAAIDDDGELAWLRRLLLERVQPALAGKGTACAP